MSQDLPEATLALEGGARIRTREWPTYDRGYVDLSDEDEAAALRAIRSRRLFRYDNRPHAQTEVGQLEQELADYFSAPYALACSSGTTALVLALLGAGIGPGDIVACPAFTFAATPSAILLTGAKPLVVEVDENLHMDPADLQLKLAATPAIRAVVPVHMRGLSCDIERLVDIANSYDVPVFEDAVPALGVTLGSQKLGTFGKAGAFSTQSDKAINTGEGGFLITSDSDIFQKAVIFSGAYEDYLSRHTDPAPPTISSLTLPIYSFRMDEIRGAIARQQLVGLDARVAKLQENFRYLESRVSGLEVIKLRQPAVSGAFLGESLVFRLPGVASEQVTWFVRALNAEGIGARALGDDAMPNVRCFWNWRFAFPESSQEVITQQYKASATFLKESVDVPMSITLNKSDCDQLADAITKVCQALSRRIRH